MPTEIYGLQDHFADLEQQQETDVFGMWLFLATEVLFFGGIFLGYIVYRTMHPLAFSDAAGFMDVPIGTINTAVLLTSSFTAALAVRAAKLGRAREVAALLAATVLFGAVFMVLKGVEYSGHIREHQWPGSGFHYPGPEKFAAAGKLFFCFYFAMTGFHALHVLIGMAVLAGIGVKAWRGRYTAEYYASVEVAGLYWHFVDIVWIFLYPLLYLMRMKGV
jgi:cytochrome c oxidase subunit 3